MTPPIEKSRKRRLKRDIHCVGFQHDGVPCLEVIKRDKLPDKNGFYSYPCCPAKYPAGYHQTENQRLIAEDPKRRKVADNFNDQLMDSEVTRGNAGPQMDVPRGPRVQHGPWLMDREETRGDVDAGPHVPRVQYFGPWPRPKRIRKVTYTEESLRAILGSKEERNLTPAKKWKKLKGDITSSDDDVSDDSSEENDESGN